MISRSEIAKLTIIGIFSLVGIVVGAGALGCTDTCPVFSQVHFDRFVDLVMYIGFGGAVYVGIRMTQQSVKKAIEEALKKKKPED